MGRADAIFSLRCAPWLCDPPPVELAVHPPPPRPCALQVVALKESSEYARVYQLLNIFAAGRVSDFVAFVGTGDNKAWMEALGVNVEGSERTVRLLTLASLASTSNQISYATVAEALQVCMTCRVCCVCVCGVCACVNVPLVHCGEDRV